MTNKGIKKISIIGTGFVGTTSAYTLMLSGLVSEMVLIDINETKTDGEVMDLNLNTKGIDRIIEIPLDAEEMRLLHKSAESLKNTIKSSGF